MNEQLIKEACEQINNHQNSDMSDTFDKMISYINMLERTQKNLLKRYFALRKTVKWQNKLLNRMYVLMNKGQRNILSVWIGDQNDAT